MARSYDSAFEAFEHDVGRCSRIVEVGRLVGDMARRVVGVSALNFIPLGDQPGVMGEAYNFAVDNPVEEVNATALLFEKEFESEVLPFEQLFRRAPCCLDLNAVRGQRFLETTTIYNEFWRRFRIERQVLASMGDRHDPLGFITFVRRVSDPAFGDDDLRTMERIRGIAERAVLGLRTFDVAAGVESVLRNLEESIPLAAWLFDDLGRLCWMTREASLRLNLAAMQVGSRRLRWGSREVIEALQAVALGTFHHPERTGAGCLHDHANILRAGERLVVKPVSKELFNRPCALVAIREKKSTAAEQLHPGRLQSLGLSPREAEVASLAAQGYTVANIAGNLNIRDSTVQSHLKSIYRKLGVTSRAELACRAMVEDD